MATQYFTAASLDGFIATEDHSLEWLFQLGDVADTGYESFIANVGAMAMGSATYQWMQRNVDAWPYALPTWVFSSQTLTPFTTMDPAASESPVVGESPAVSKSPEIHFVSGDVRPVHAEMTKAANGKNIWLVGGGELVGQFYDAGLLDELFITIGSVTLGSGKPLLPREIAFPPLQLQSAKQLGAGFVELHYLVPKPAT